MTVVSKVFWLFVLTMVVTACATVAARGPGRLTAAEIKSRVVVDKTTKHEIFELFGGPNEKKVNEDGSEVWFYERISQESSDQNANIFLFIIGASSAQSASSVRSFMLTMHFDPKGILKKYAVRESQF